MQIETIVNGGVTLVLSPENPMEEEVLKQLMRQTNELIEIRSGAQILGRQFNSGIVIGKKKTTESPTRPVLDSDKPEQKPDAGKEEEV